VVSAYGVEHAVLQAARDRGMKLIDATCPVVTRAHSLAFKLAEEGYQLIAVGDHGHPEMVTLKEALGDKVKEVRVTLRLTDSPACLVVDRDAMSAHLQRLLKAAGQKVPATPPILELNPQHPLVQRLKFEEAKLADWAHLLFEQAQLAEGGALDDPAAFVRRMNELLLDAGARK
ncbi:MAG TPA: hypothetical protein VNK91_02510, partial [Burkholderiaceae bacterium]|nr:hypothetical protein [Burkholderiaceae bacterium]